MRKQALWIIAAVYAILTLAQPVLTQEPTATPRGSTRGFDPVMATFEAAFGATPAPTPTPTPITYTRGYDPLFLTMQAWANNTVTTEPAPTPITYTRGYDPLFLTMQAWAANIVATEPPCAWMWASQPLTEQNTIVQAALDAAGAQAVTFEASAFGENCVDGETQEVRSFIARDVVFRLTVAGSDAAALGDLLARALPLIQMAVKAQSQPLAEISIIFTDADLDPLTLTPQLLDRTLEPEASGAALVARLYEVSLR